MREEDFGGIIGSRYGGNALVDLETYKIFSEIKDRPLFTAKEVSKKYKVDLSEAIQVFSWMLYQNLIKEGGLK